MVQTLIYEGTPEQLAKQLSKLPDDRKYRITITPEEPEAIVKSPKMITFGMFPQLQSLADEDFKSAEWRGKDIELS